MMPVSTHSIAALAFERLFYCLTAGTALVGIVSVALALVPARNSQTRFAVWFSALLAVAVLPFSAWIPVPWMTKSSASAHAFFTISSSWAQYIVLTWGVLAGFGLLRVGLGIWQLRRLRRNSVELSKDLLDPPVAGLIVRFAGRRPVSLLVSPRVEVPTAIGFFRPVIILPQWLVSDRKVNADRDPAGRDSGSDDLKYILLHELAHLRRWDDWTNLAQKVVKSVFFFHPGILWIERKLALDREMACDDAVLSETGSPRTYAQCLTNVAERSFLRREIAMAQAAVSRVKQLSRRVAWIMNPQRSHNTRIWKPAIPLVAGAALICAASASNSCELIGFSDSAPAASSHPVVAHTGTAFTQQAGRLSDSTTAKLTPATLNAPAGVRALPADLKYGSTRRSRPVPRRAAIPASPHPNVVQRATLRGPDRGLQTHENNQNQVRLIMSSYSAPLLGEPTGTDGVVLVIFSSKQVSTDKDRSWQIRSWELYFYLPPPAKQIPRKT
jgi:beta-lactamase regulating signal transducer with metallopeptidase domain